VHPTYRVPGEWRADGRWGLGIGYLYVLCVINVSHTFRLTFFKLCTVVMDTLKSFEVCGPYLGHLSHSGDLLLSVFVRRRPSSFVRKLLNIFSFFSGTAVPISTKFGL
jgi:hypothetical protein